MKVTREQYLNSLLHENHYLAAINQHVVNMDNTARGFGCLTPAIVFVTREPSPYSRLPIDTTSYEYLEHILSRKHLNGKCYYVSCGKIIPEKRVLRKNTNINVISINLLCEAISFLNPFIVCTLGIPASKLFFVKPHAVLNGKVCSFRSMKLCAITHPIIPAIDIIDCVNYEEHLYEIIEKNIGV